MPPRQNTLTPNSKEEEKRLGSGSQAFRPVWVCLVRIRLTTGKGAKDDDPAAENTPTASFDSVEELKGIQPGSLESPIPMHRDSRLTGTTVRQVTTIDGIIRGNEAENCISGRGASQPAPFMVAENEI